MHNGQKWVKAFIMISQLYKCQLNNQQSNSRLNGTIKCFTTTMASLCIMRYSVNLPCELVLVLCVLFGPLDCGGTFLGSLTNSNIAAKPCRCFFSSTMNSIYKLSPVDIICSPLRVLQYIAIAGAVESCPSRTSIKSGLDSQLEWNGKHVNTERYDTQWIFLIWLPLFPK